MFAVEADRAGFAGGLLGATLEGAGGTRGGERHSCFAKVPRWTNQRGFFCARGAVEAFGAVLGLGELEAEHGWRTHGAECDPRRPRAVGIGTARAKRLLNCSLVAKIPEITFVGRACIQGRLLRERVVKACRAEGVVLALFRTV